MKYFLFPTHSNLGLAQKIISKSKHLTQGKCKITHYQDGEILVHINGQVKHKKVYVLGATFPPAENVLELIILINTLKENGARKVVALIPYFGYGKQDRKKYSGDAMSAKLMANIIELAGASEIIALDLHSQLVKKYFSKKITNLSANQLLAEYFLHCHCEERPEEATWQSRRKLNNDWTVIAPDKGGIKRAQAFAKHLKIKNIAYIEKFRPQIDQSKIVNLTGDVKGKNCIIVDDLSQTGGTLIEGAKFLKKKGAGDIYVVLTHLVATGPVVKNLNKEKNIKEIIITDSIKLPVGIRKNKKFGVVSCAELFSHKLN